MRLSLPSLLCPVMGGNRFMGQGERVLQLAHRRAHAASSPWDTERHRIVGIVEGDMTIGANRRLFPDGEIVRKVLPARA